LNELAENGIEEKDYSSRSEENDFKEQ